MTAMLLSDLRHFMMLTSPVVVSSCTGTQGNSHDIFLFWINYLCVTYCLVCCIGSCVGVNEGRTSLVLSRVRVVL